VSIELRDDPRTHGSIRPPGPGSDQWLSEADALLDVGAHLVDALELIAARELPDQCDLSKDGPGNAARWLSGESNSLTMAVLPEHVQQWFIEVREDLRVQARRVFELVRWVSNARDTHPPLAGGMLEFSLDGHTWHHAPSEPPGKPFDLRAYSGVDLDALNVDAISELAIRGQSEPVGHSLIREALSLRPTAPRPAVVLGAAAAETAAKEAIHRLLPAAAYLIDELPSPPVDKLVAKYLPELGTRSALNLVLLPPPKPVMRSLKWLIETRNRVVHNREQSHRFPELLGALVHVRDLMWVLDCYCGHDWAFANLSPETAVLYQAPPDSGRTSGAAN
jgi:hypothetical protein